MEAVAQVTFGISLEQFYFVIFNGHNDDCECVDFLSLLQTQKVILT